MNDREHDFGEALLVAWRKSGGTAGVLVAASPTLVFVVTSTLAGVTAAVVAAAVTAAATFAYRLARREALGGALAGLVVAAACALLAAVTGEARGFFLLPTVLPAVILLVCLATVIARRPLTGLLLNRVAGGPPNWRHQRRLLRVYDISTLIAVVVNAVNFALQAFFYAADEPVVLAAAHVAIGPVFATLVAGTLLAVRRAIAVDRAVQE
jgi:drug/metabolite transporter (DMT)-like permease